MSDQRIPSITVVIPTYNCAAYIGDAIRSVLELNDPQISVIVINDGSTDNTREVLQQFASVPCVQVVHIANRGLGPARNLGLELAASEYVYFLDGDDLIAPHFSITIAAALAENPQDSLPDLVCFGGEAFVDGDYSGSFAPDYSRKISGRYRGQGAAIRPLVNAGSFFPNAYFYLSRRRLWTETGLAFKAIYHEDEELIVQLFAAASDVVVLKESLYRRRVRPGSIMTSGFGPKSVRGYEVIIESTLAMLRSDDPVLDRHRDILRERLFGFLTRYSKGARQNGHSPNYRLCLRALSTLRSIEASVRVLRDLVSVTARKA